MKRLLLLFSLAFIMSFGFSIERASAQAEIQIVTDNLINVNRRSPDRNKYADNDKKIKKNKPKIHSKSRYDCLSYGLWSSKAIEKRRKQLSKQRKQVLARK